MARQVMLRNDTVGVLLDLLLAGWPIAWLYQSVAWRSYTPVFSLRVEGLTPLRAWIVQSFVDEYLESIEPDPYVLCPIHFAYAWSLRDCLRREDTQLQWTWLRHVLYGGAGFQGLYAGGDLAEAFERLGGVSLRPPPPVERLRNLAQWFSYCHDPENLGFKPDPGHLWRGPDEDEAEELVRRKLSTRGDMPLLKEEVEALRALAVQRLIELSGESAGGV
ncbi:MAG: hypothetical protein AB1725_03275 [Armatimonadota bacterium]